MRRRALGPVVTLDSVLVRLLNLHTVRRRLLLMIERKQRRGEITDDLRAELALNRSQAKALLASLQADH